MTHSINVWSEIVHGLAVVKGWWEKQTLRNTTGDLDIEAVKLAVPEKLTLIHDEISEASTEARSDRYDTRWPTASLPGWPEGDVSLRGLRNMIDNAYGGDTTARECLRKLREYLDIMVTVTDPDYEAPSAEETLQEFVTALCEKHKPEGFGIEMVDSIIRSLDLLEALGYDVGALMEMKHTYNKTRSYRHGNKKY